MKEQAGFTTKGTALHDLPLQVQVLASRRNLAPACLNDSIVGTLQGIERLVDWRS